MPIATSSARGAGLVGIDIGGTKIAALLVSDDGAVLARGSVPAPAALGGGAMADAAADLARELAAQAEVTLAAAGVGAAGVIDHETGTIRAAIGDLRRVGRDSRWPTSWSSVSRCRSASRTM